MPGKSSAAFVLFLIVVSAGRAASAQDKGDIGVNLGYPLVGVTWHVTGNVAVRPEFDFSITSSSTATAGGLAGGDSDGWAVGFGVSGLFYVADWDGVRGYVAPRFAFIRGRADGLITIEGEQLENLSSGFDLGAAAGAQYAFNPRVSVFGEIGLNYSDRHSETDTTGTLVLGIESDSWSISPRTAVGLVVYF